MCSACPERRRCSLRATLLAVLLTAALLPAAAQEAPTVSPLTLPDVLAEVARQNPTLRAAGLDAEALAAGASQASAWPDPTVGLMLQPYPMLTAHGAQRSQWRLEQMIPYPGKRRLAGEVAALDAAVAAREVDVLAADLLLQAKQAYIELYQSQALEALVAAFQEELRGFEEAAAVRYEVGTGMQQAVLKAQLEKNALAQRLIDLQRARRTAAETLAALTGRPGGARFFGTAHLERPPLPTGDAAALLALAGHQRPEVAVLSLAAERADRAVALAERAFRPDFGVNVTYTDIAARPMPPTANGRDALAVGVMVRIPLQRERLRAGVREATLRRDAVAARQEALRVAVATEIEDLLFALEQEAATLRLYDETLLPQATSTVEATLASYTTGRTDFLDLLDAERSQFTLHAGYEEAYARYLSTAAALERTLGIDSLADLAKLLADDATPSTPARSND